jgi:hypothetical protein
VCQHSIAGGVNCNNENNKWDKRLSKNRIRRYDRRCVVVSKATLSSKQLPICYLC